MWDKLTKPGQVLDPQLDELWNNVKKKLEIVADQVKDKGPTVFAGVLPFLQDKDLLKWTESLTESAATVYDKAMDKVFLNKLSLGGEHRLFDGGHTLGGSWEAVRNALPDDSFTQEVMEWGKAYVKDLTTTKGMPFSTLEKENFDGWVDAIVGNIPGVKRNYLYDLLSFDAMEICVTGLSVVGIFFAFKDDDKERLMEILGAMGISSIMSANPILGLVTIATTAYSYWKHGRVSMVPALKGGGITAISVIMFSMMSLPIIVELVIVVSLTILLKKQILENEKIAEWLKAKIQESLQGPMELLNVDTLTSLLPSILPSRGWSFARLVGR